MKVALIGAEIEENLALRHMHASLEAAGHEPALFGFSSRGELDAVAARVTAWQPELIGLSMLFTSRSREFVELARRLRALGFTGHLTAGGHFAAFHGAELLRDHPAFDSIAHGEGEELMVELCARLDEPSSVPGLSVRGAHGQVVSTGPRPNRKDLDARPWPTRPERFHRYLGLPIANLLSSRGCFGSCHFCSIHATHRLNGGPHFRQRDVGCVAAEMAALYHQRGVRIFNFQDDNFFMPTPEASLARVRALDAAMRAEGIGRVALQVKARPDSIEPRVVDALVDIGLFRVFLGVETDAVSGLRRLGRGIQRQQNHRALAILAERGVHTCFNLLMFDPDSDMASLRENLAFMARQHSSPLNFCRVEVYAGTALEAQLRDQGRLQGDYMGQTYTIADPAAQRSYELFWRVFAPRNFGEGGLHHESMRLDYHLHLLRHFRPGRVDADLWRRCKALVAELNRDSAERMGQLLDRAEAMETDADLDAVAADLRRGRARADRRLSRETAALLARIQAITRAQAAPRSHLRAARPAVVAALMATAWVGADAALAQDDDGGGEEATQATETTIPELDEPEEKPPPVLVPVDLPDRLPDTHMCEAAPPPWDLYNQPPPPPPPDIAPRLLQLKKIGELRLRYLEVCTLAVTITTGDNGKVTAVLAHSNPHQPELRALVEEALLGVRFPAEYSGRTHKALLWEQFVRQVIEVEE